ncbi:MAG TPA: GNAT family N-acetyltransferase [Terracidiphilus sp.]|nr:GNAT family N-acetyltransferase [Terracidiphilus sp.]
MTSITAPVLRFRLAAPADAPRLIELINTAFAVETFLEGTRTDPERLAAMMEKGSILLAEDGDGRLAASVYMAMRGERGRYLGMLAVDPVLQGRGLGREMVEAAEERFRAQGCETVEITVLSLRPELPPLYRKLGYAETGVEDFKPSVPLKDGMACHCIVMSKTL